VCKIVRRQILHDMREFIDRCLQEPNQVSAELIAGVRAYLGPDYDSATPYAPRYCLSQQRIAFIPEGDIFKGVASGKASMVTDEIAFHGDGRPAPVRALTRGGHHRDRYQLQSQRDGRHSVRRGWPGRGLGKDRDQARHDVHRRAKPTVDLRQLPRQLNAARRPARGLRLPPARIHTTEKCVQGRGCHAAQCARHAAAVVDGSAQFNPNYLMRSMHLLPQRGDSPEWQHTPDYWRKQQEIPAIDLEDPVFVYERTSGNAGSCKAAG
jgi:cation diffusion facilitator CzcD-associated flavoprotein CzcO